MSEIGDAALGEGNGHLSLDPQFYTSQQVIQKGSSSLISDQLKAGEIRLIETTPEESAAAKARLDKVRKKRRERHAKKKQSN